MLNMTRIYKDKYKDDDEKLDEPRGRRGRSNTMASTASKKQRDKSKTRSFFRKKSTASNS
jgi:hypothetical protein